MSPSEAIEILKVVRSNVNVKLTFSEQSISLGGNGQRNMNTKNEMYSQVETRYSAGGIGGIVAGTVGSSSVHG